MKLITFTLANLFILGLSAWVLFPVFPFDGAPALLSHNLAPAARAACLSLGLFMLFQLSLMALKQHKKLHRVLISRQGNDHSDKPDPACPAPEATGKLIGRPFNTLG